MEPPDTRGEDRVIQPDLLVDRQCLVRWMSFVGLMVQPNLSRLAMEYFYRLGRDPALIAETNRGFRTDAFPFNKDTAFTGFHDKTEFWEVTTPTTTVISWLELVVCTNPQIGAYFGPQMFWPRQEASTAFLRWYDHQEPTDLILKVNTNQAYF